MEQNLQCTGCSMPRDEWWTDENDPDAEEELKRRAKDMVKGRLCAACYARDARDEKLRNEDPKPDLRGIHTVFIQP